jgi:hypothetical protein
MIPPYHEEVKGCICCEDAADFLVIARHDERLVTHGTVYVRVYDREAHYVFLQDRTAKVWQMTSFSSAGFLKKKQVLGLLSQGGDRRQIVISSIREPQENQVSTCIAMAVFMSRGPISILSPEFQWTPYDPDDAKAMFELVR